MADPEAYPLLQTERLDETELYEWVRRQLGYPRVDVELDQEHVKDAMVEALAEYSTYKPRRVTESWVAPPDVSQHFWKTKGVRGVFDIQAERVRPTMMLETDYEGLTGKLLSPALISVNLGQGLFRPPTFDIPLLEYTRQWQKIVANELSAEVSWKLADDKLSVWISSPGVHTGVQATLTLDHVSPLTIPSYDEGWFRKYVVAYVKANALGHMRSKFGEIFGANQSLHLDGDSLKTEGREDLEKLIAEIKSKRAFAAPSFG